MEHHEDNEDSAEWLLHILKQVQLEQFYVRIRDHLQISRMSHFEYVTADDLEKVCNIGVSVVHTYFNSLLPCAFSRLAWPSLQPGDSSMWSKRNGGNKLSVDSFLWENLEP